MEAVVKDGKSLLVLLLAALCAGCGEDSNPTESVLNVGPGAFTVQVDTTGFDAVLEWSTPADPEGDALTYSVFLDGREVASGLASMTFALEGLEYETDFSGRVVALDGNGGSSEASFAFTSRAVRIEWETSLGGSEGDSPRSIRETADGGFLVAGGSTSSDGDVGSNQGNYDAWIVRLDASGALVWERSFGGSGVDAALDALELADGTIIVGGSTTSDDFAAMEDPGMSDYWLARVTSDGSAIQWLRTFGGSNGESPRSMARVDGHVVVVGGSTSSDGDVGGNHGQFDYWVVAVDDETGSLDWEENLGGSADDIATSIAPAAGGGSVVAGFSESSDQDVSGNEGGNDLWIVALDPSGAISWEVNLGGTGTDDATSVRQTAAGGYLVAGYSTSSDGDVGANNGWEDVWVVELDGAGNLVWENNLGGNGTELATAVLPTPDGGVLVAAETDSDDGDVARNQGAADYWLVKLDGEGNLLWERTFGGSADDFVASLTPVSDGGWILAGQSESADGDVSGNHGDRDFWIVKVR